MMRASLVQIMSRASCCTAERVGSEVKLWSVHFSRCAQAAVTWKLPCVCSRSLSTVGVAIFFMLWLCPEDTGVSYFLH